ncbi:MAG: efflux RND transporter periplasmic adaptor subunit, partial [Calditrichaeota bacterium]
KLKNWKLSDAQIDHVIELGKPQENFPILADISGVVLNKRVKLGDHVHTGSSLFEVADLSKIWVLFDVYESDMPWIKTGDAVAITIQSLPGEKFSGKISFIDPVINPKTRVARARIELKNPGQRLKPEMFANGLVKSPLKGSEPALVVPKSAVMWTGERSVVYVKNTSATNVGFALREVTLGPGLGDSYVIKDGLQEGEEIATNGTFSIDAAAQLAGKPSMMNPEGGAQSMGHNHGDMNMQDGEMKRPHSDRITLGSQAKQVIVILFDKYLKLKDALTKDNREAAIGAATELSTYLEKVKMSVFKGDAHIQWMKHGEPIKTGSLAIAKSKDLVAARKQFIDLSIHVITLAKRFGPFDKPLFVQFCPMADENRGAEWLSRESEIRNPYFGDSMLMCGEVRQSIK